MAGKQARCTCGTIVTVPMPQATNAFSAPADDPFAGLGDLGAWSQPVAPIPPTSYAAAYSSPQATTPTRPRRPTQTRAIPEAAKAACGGLLAGAVVWTIVSGIAIGAILGGHGDAIAKAITAYWTCLALGGYVSGLLIWLRAPFALVPAVVVAAAYAMFFPIGTLIGVFIFLKLFDKETRAYLS